MRCYITPVVWLSTVVKVACLEVESVFREPIAKRNIITLNGLEALGLIPASFQTVVVDAVKFVP